MGTNIIKKNETQRVLLIFCYTEQIVKQKDKPRDVIMTYYHFKDNVF